MGKLHNFIHKIVAAISPKVSDTWLHRKGYIGYATYWLTMGHRLEYNVFDKTYTYSDYRNKVYGIRFKYELNYIVRLCKRTDAYTNDVYGKSFM